MDNGYFDIRTELIDKSPRTRLFHIVGQRGAGKTYSVKKEVLNRFLEMGRKFVYVRRITTDIQTGNLE